jgi:hypothetical protein
MAYLETMMQLEVRRQLKTRMIDELQEQEEPTLDAARCQNRIKIIERFIVKFIAHDFLFENDKFIILDKLPDYL